jgi:transcriptional regulator with XRE-family HTH domain
MPREITDINRIIGERIKYARIAANKTMVQLGKALGITHQQIQKYETGKDNVTVYRLLDIAKHLGREMSYFIDDIENSSPPEVKNPITLATIRKLMSIKNPKYAQIVREFIFSIAKQEKEDVNSNNIG